jgi:O-antigen ligase
MLFTTVALAPLLFGSTDPSSGALWCVVLGIGLIAASPQNFCKSRAIFLGLVAIIIAAYGIVLHEQLAAHPWFATPNPLWHQSSQVLGTPLQGSASIARNQPFFALGPPLAALLALVCSFVVCADQDRAHQLLKVIAWSGVGYAVFGIGSYWIDPTHILWREKEAYSTALTSTFVNRNTAAVYFGSSSVVWLLLLAQRLRRLLSRNEINFRTLLGRILSGTETKIATTFSMLLICLAAMFMTGSRAGIVLSLIVLFIAFVAFFRRDFSTKGNKLAAFATGAGAIAILLQFMGAGVSGRFDAQGLADEGRIETYRGTLRMIADRPWFGSGLGTFAWSYPAYRSDHVSMWGVWDRAHNTLLELGAELGVPLAGLVALGWVVILLALARSALGRRRPAALPIAAFSIAILAVSHSLIDFSLQVPGYSIVVFALVGAGVTVALSERSKSASSASVNE